MNDVKRPPPYVARRHLWLRPGEPLVCPNGHRIKHNVALLQHEAFICQHRVQHGVNGECNARSYVLLFPGGLRFMAEVTVAEMAWMRNNCPSVEAVLDYLQGNAA